VWIAANGPDNSICPIAGSGYTGPEHCRIDSHGGADMGEYKHGSMDTTEQEKTFAGLIKASVIVIVATVMALIFLAFVGT
jgi:hypothetical protein